MIPRHKHKHPAKHDHQLHGGHEHPVPVAPPLDADDPGPGIVGKLKSPAKAVFLRRQGDRAAVKTARNPLPKGSFGYVGRFVRLAAESEGEIDGTLVIGVEPKRLGSVAPETLRVFRWDRAQHGFALVERSQPGASGNYVWARVAKTGLYAVIGINTDPLIARTLAVFAALDGWLGLPVGRGATLGSRICQLILCEQDLRNGLGDPDVARAMEESNARLGIPVGWGGVGPVTGGGPCEFCLGIGFEHSPLGGIGLQRPPELQSFKFCLDPFSRGGRWRIAPVVPAPADVVLAIHAALLHTGKVLYFGGSENVESQHNAGAIDNTRLWDPATGAITTLPSPAHDLFCCGHAMLADGRLLVAGGTKAWGNTSTFHGSHFAGLRDTTIFDPGAVPPASPWTITGSMNPQRGMTAGGGAWYPTLMTLPDGRILRLGGHPQHDDTRHVNTMVEIFDPSTGTWTDEGVGADIPRTTGEVPSYGRIFVLPDGRFFLASSFDGDPNGNPPVPAWQCWIYDPTAKQWSTVCPSAQPAYFGYDATAVLLPLLPSEGYRARILMAGHDPAQIIDFGVTSPSWRDTSARALVNPVTGKPPYRYRATSVLLPDASVLVVGGHSDPMNWQPPVLTPERYDPISDTWSTLAAAAVPRVYHSVALLLPDGRVWTAGSDYGNGNHEARMELFEPPYLFQGPRPKITSVAPPTIAAAGTSFDVDTPQANDIAAVALLRCGSATHAFLPDQRYVGLVVQSRTSSKLTLAPPPNRNVAPPGYYLLFIVDTNGVPSIGEFVRVT